MVLFWKLCKMSYYAPRSSCFLCCMLQPYAPAVNTKGDRELRAIVSERCQGHRMKGAVPLHIALPSWSCLKTDHSVKKIYVSTKWLQPCSQEGWIHIFLGWWQPRVDEGPGSALGVLSTLRNFKGNHCCAVTCGETPQPERWQSFQQVLEWARAAKAAFPLPPNCSTPPLTTSGIETFVSVSFLMRALIRNVIYHKLTLQLNSEPNCYITICCVCGKHNRDCVSIRYKHNKCNHQRK